jgi:hypothetical protein
MRLLSLFTKLFKKKKLRVLCSQVAPMVGAHGFVHVTDKVPVEGDLTRYRLKDTLLCFQVNQPKRLVKPTQESMDAIRAYYAFRGHRILAVTVLDQKGGSVRYPINQFRHTDKNGTPTTL